jgi:hypothetical protein
MDVGSEMIYTLVPLFLANVLGVNKSFVGLIEGIAESTASFTKVFPGSFPTGSDAGKRSWPWAMAFQL